MLQDAQQRQNGRAERNCVTQFGVGARVLASEVNPTKMWWVEQSGRLRGALEVVMILSRHEVVWRGSWEGTGEGREMEGALEMGHQMVTRCSRCRFGGLP